jgi:hypothetical protein
MWDGPPHSFPSESFSSSDIGDGKKECELPGNGGFVEGRAVGNEGMEIEDGFDGEGLRIVGRGAPAPRIQPRAGFAPKLLTRMSYVIC